MTEKCCVKDCSSENSFEDELTFHNLPLNDPEILKVWLNRIKLSELSFSSRICSLHFSAECFVTVNGRKTLMSTAIPVNEITNNIQELKPAISNDEFVETRNNSADQKTPQAIHLVKQALKTLLELEESHEIDQIIDPLRPALLHALQQVEQLTQNVMIIKEEPNEEREPENDVASEFVAIEMRNEEDESDESEKPLVKRKNKTKEKKIEAGNFPCENCDKIFETKNQRKNHIYNHHQGPFFCDRCGKIFPSKRALTSHMPRHESLNLRRMKCPQCNLMIMRDSLRRHIRARHQGVKSHTW
jgi:hypothetical protein